MSLGIEKYSHFLLDPVPPPTEEIIQCFNDLRTDIVVWNELKTAWQSLENELQTLKLKFEQLSPGKVSQELPENL